MVLLENKIQDKRFLELIRKALNAGYLYANKHDTDLIGIPHGSIISPILANIFLHQLDVYIDKIKSVFDAPKSSHITKERIKYLIAKSKTIEDRKLRIRELRKFYRLTLTVNNKILGPHSRKLMYVRYADD